MPRSLALTAVLTRRQNDGFTAEFKELPQFLVDGADEEEASCKLISELASYLTWRSVQELRASDRRPSPNDALELQIV